MCFAFFSGRFVLDAIFDCQKKKFPQTKHLLQQRDCQQLCCVAYVLLSGGRYQMIAVSWRMVWYLGMVEVCGGYGWFFDPVDARETWVGPCGVAGA